MLGQLLKIIRTPEFDLHVMVVCHRVLRVAMTAVGEELPVPTIGVRPELRAAMDNVRVNEVSELGQPDSERHVDLGEFILSWRDHGLSVKTKRGDDGHHQLVAEIENLQIVEGKPSCTMKRLGSKKVYGCGEKYGWINKMGTTTVHWNTDVMGLTDLHHGLQKEYHTAIPFFLTEVGTPASPLTLEGGPKQFREGAFLSDLTGFAGYYFDNSWRTYFDFDKGNTGCFKFTADGGPLDFYFMFGSTVQEVVRSFAHVTGTMPMPRLDFLGYQQCRWSYMNQNEVLEIAKEMRKHQIPCDVMYLDIDYMKDYKVFTIDRDRFPNFKDMNDQLKEMGFKTVAILDPGVKAERGYGVYDRGLEGDVYVQSAEGLPYVGEVWPGRSVYPDFLNAKARRWWGQEHEILFLEGVDGIWNDMNEPADFTTKSKTIPETCLHRDDGGKVISHAQVHNLYATYEAKATFDTMCGYESHGTEALATLGTQRPFILTRSASAGAQRYSAIWTGDNSSLWEHLESAVPMLLNLGLSGYAYTGGDVGGFQKDGDGELLARWTQLGAFMPLFRNHSAMDTIDQEPWRFGESILSITKGAIELRYSLLTYLYQQMRGSHLTGDPVMRPLFYQTRGGGQVKAGEGFENEQVEDALAVIDSEMDLWNINDQFLYGPDLMVCPIVRPYLSKRAVYFPVNGHAAGGWYDLVTGERYPGGTWAVVDAPLEKIPVYVREGSMVPRDLIRQSLPKSNPFESLVIEIYGAEEGPLSKGTASFYFDDGLSTTVSAENSVVLTVAYQVKEEGTLAVTTTSEGAYPLPKLDFVWRGADRERKILRSNS